MHPYWCLCKKRTNAQDIYTLGKALGGSRDRTGVAASQGTPSTARSHKKMEEARRDSSLGLTEGAWPCLDFGLLTSRTVRK